jgi:hypothetical protein
MFLRFKIFTKIHKKNHMNKYLSKNYVHMACACKKNVTKSVKQVTKTVHKKAVPTSHKRVIRRPAR